MKILDFPQGGHEWKAYRAGRVTASRIADLTAKTKSGYGASRANYAAELITERLTGNPVEKFETEAMRWGVATEAEARDCYSFMHDAAVVQVGCVEHPKITMACASPDGLVGNDGLVEFKCPGSATHIEFLLTEKIPEKYVKQMQWQMACTGRAWCDFVSFDPRLSPEMQIMVKRVPRENEFISELEDEVIQFLAEIDDKLSKLQAKFGVKEAA